MAGLPRYLILMSYFLSILIPIKSRSELNGSRCSDGTEQQAQGPSTSAPDEASTILLRSRNRSPPTVRALRPHCSVA